MAVSVGLTAARSHSYWQVLHGAYCNIARTPDVAARPPCRARSSTLRADRQHGTCGLRNHLVRHSGGQMGGADITPGVAQAKNNQIGLFCFRDFENLFARRAVYDDSARRKDEAVFVTNERSEMIERELFDFVGLNEVAGLGLFHDVEQSELRLLFLRQTKSEGRSRVGAFTEIRGEQDFAEFFRARLMESNVRAHRQNGARRLTQNFLGN